MSLRVPHRTTIIHIVDDDPSMRTALRRVLRQAGHPLQTHESAEAFLETYDGQPGCVLLDLAMPGMGGEALLDEIRRRDLNLVVLVLTGQATIKTTIRIIRGGALDLMEKPVSNEALLDRLDAALAGAVPVFAHRALVEDYRARLARLTRREREVLELLVAGLTSSDIATRLYISKKTVDIHRSRVMQKMEVVTATELLFDWITLG